MERLEDETAKEYMERTGEHPSVTFHRERVETHKENLWGMVEYVPNDGVTLVPDLDRLIEMIAGELDALDVEVPFL